MPTTKIAELTVIPAEFDDRTGITSYRIRLCDPNAVTRRVEFATLDELLERIDGFGNEQTVPSIVTVMMPRGARKPPGFDKRIRYSTSFRAPAAMTAPAVLIPA